MKHNELDTFNTVLSHIVNSQENISQPIYAIASYWCGVFNGICSIFSTNGDNDYEEIKKVFIDKYAWKPNQIGVTEQTYALIKIDTSVILDCNGDEYGK